MQQTKLDRFLREKYAYITHIFSNTKPAEIPRGVRFEELDRENGAPFRYRFSSKKYHLIEKLAKQLESENITYTSRVSDRKIWYRGLINNSKKSFSYRLLWMGLVAAMVGFAFSPIPKRIVAYIQAEEVVAKPGEEKESMVDRIVKIGDKLDSYVGISQKWNELFNEDKTIPVRQAGSTKPTLPSQ